MCVRERVHTRVCVCACARFLRRRHFLQGVSPGPGPPRRQAVIDSRAWFGCGCPGLPQKSPVLSPPRRDGLPGGERKERGQLCPSAALGSRGCEGQDPLVTLAEMAATHGRDLPPDPRRSLCRAPRPPHRSLTPAEAQLPSKRNVETNYFFEKNVTSSLLV